MQRHLLFSNERIRVFRVPLGEATIVCKQVLGRDAPAAVRRERELLARLGGVRGIPALAHAVTPPDVLALLDQGGVPLALLLRTERLAVPAILVLGLQVSRILAAVHAHGVVHRDVSPANIVLLGAGRDASLVKFDTAATLAELATAAHPHRVVGTLAYMPPEQAGDGARPVDHRADLYALGATLYELAVGHPPFSELDALQLVHAQLTRTPPAPATLAPDVPPLLSALIMRLLDKEPDRRYQSADGLAYDLAQLAERLAAGKPLEFPLGRRDFPPRLRAPERLIGRDAERAMLLDAFDQAAGGAARTVLLCGPTGSGKSRLVGQLRPAVVARGGYFLKGKFDQQRQDRQADALAQVFRQLAHQLLAEPEEELARIRAAVLGALGVNAGLVAAMSAEFAILLAVPPEDLATSQDTPVRVLTAATDLLRAIASPGRPLVIVVEELQWAHPLALRLLDLWVRPGLHNLLLVGEWRSDALPAEHAQAAQPPAWERHAARIDLHDLPVAQVAELLEEMLRLPAPQAAALAAELARHTGGNPYETVALVNTLRQAGVLRVTGEGWTWDAVEVRQHVGTSSVFDLLRARIASLPADTRAVLDVMACLGGEIPAAVLESAAGLAPGSAASLLAAALDDGLVAAARGPDGATLVRFRHDRVREAVHQSMDPAARSTLHLAIARRLDAMPPGATETVALTAEQYLPVAALLQYEERWRAIKLFRQAAQQLRLSNAAACNRLLEAAIGLLGEPTNPGSIHFLTLLRCERHAALVALGRADDADALHATIEASGAPALDVVAAATLQVLRLTLRGRAADAIALGQRMLARLDVALPPLETPERIAAELEAFKQWISQASSADPHALPEVTDPRIMAAARILERCAPAAFLLDTRLLARIGLAGWHLCAAHGICAPLIAPLNYIGMVSIRLHGDYALGHAVSRFLLNLTAARGYVLEEARVRSVFVVTYAHWFDPIDDSVAHAHRAHDMLMQGGDQQTACLPLMAAVTATLECAPLAAAVAEASGALEVAGRVGNMVAAPYLSHVVALAARLAGDDETLQRMDPSAWPPIARTSWHILLALQGALLEDLALLDAHSAAACTMRESMYGVYNGALATVLRAVALAQRAKAAPASGRAALVAAAAPLREELMQRAADAPANFRHLLDWVNAELAWAGGDERRAAGHFDDALDALDGRPRPWHRALVTERAGHFYFACDLRQVGRRLLREACDLYHAWGAPAKVRQLERAYPFLQGGRHDPGLELARHGSVSTGTLHLHAVLRASQALSSETSLPRLHALVAEQLGTMTGATGVLMLLPAEGGGWALAGDSADAVPLPVEEAAAAGLLPLSAVRYVERTRAALVVDDLARDPRFAQDPYITSLSTSPGTSPGTSSGTTLRAAEGTTPGTAAGTMAGGTPGGRQAQCSLLVLPILAQATLRAMLVLENVQRRGAFAADRLEAVQLVARQLAVSLDNAQLYASLERKVAERTQELERANHELAALSLTDGLTGLPNRRRFDQALDAEWLRATRPRQPVGAAMIDVDQFKLYNDLYGHLQGDDCLKMVADALASSIRNGVDLVARYGGEEFAIILPGADLAETRLVAERARAAVAALQAPHLPSVHGIVTVSIGIASLVPDRDVSPDALFRAADAALYEAKQHGRNRVMAGEA